MKIDRTPSIAKLTLAGSMYPNPSGERPKLWRRLAAWIYLHVCFIP